MLPDTPSELLPVPNLIDPLAVAKSIPLEPWMLMPPALTTLTLPGVLEPEPEEINTFPPVVPAPDVIITLPDCPKESPLETRTSPDVEVEGLDVISTEPDTPFTDPEETFTDDVSDNEPATPEEDEPPEKDKESPRKFTDPPTEEEEAPPNKFNDPPSAAEEPAATDTEPLDSTEIEPPAPARPAPLWIDREPPTEPDPLEIDTEPPV